MKRKLGFISVALSAILLLNINAFAVEHTGPEYKPGESRNTGVNDLPLDLEEYYSEENVKAREKERYLSTDPRLTDPSKSLDISAVKQQKSNWCGPACLYMIIDHINGFSPSQRSIAKSIGIESSGGTDTNLALNVLNNNDITDYVQYNISQTDSFEQDIKTSIKKNYPVLCEIDTSSLKQYNGVSYIHYILVTGYGDGDFSYNDPHYSDDYFGSYEDDMGNLSNALWGYNGWYLAW